MRVTSQRGALVTYALPQDSIYGCVKVKGTSNEVGRSIHHVAFEDSLPCRSVAIETSRFPSNHLNGHLPQRHPSYHEKGFLGPLAFIVGEEQHPTAFHSYHFQAP